MDRNALTTLDGEAVSPASNGPAQRPPDHHEPDDRVQDDRADRAGEGCDGKTGGPGPGAAARRVIDEAPMDASGRRTAAVPTAPDPARPDPSFLRWYDAGFTDIVPVVPPGADIHPSSNIPPEARGKAPGWPGQGDDG